MLGARETWRGDGILRKNKEAFTARLGLGKEQLSEAFKTIAASRGLAALLRGQTDSFRRSSATSRN